MKEENNPIEEAKLLQSIETNDKLDSLNKNSEATLLETTKATDAIKEQTPALEALIKLNSELVDTIKERNKIDMTAFSDVKTITLQGEKGDKGDKGDVGDKGEKGDKGNIGIQGIKGEKGEVGKTGKAGLNGEKGEQGIMGEQGIQGEKGDKGDKGDNGSPDTPEQIAEKINSLKKSIDWKTLKNVPDMKSNWGASNQAASTESSLTLQTNSVDNGSQTLLNLIAGTNVTLTDDGLGGITIDSGGGGTQTLAQTLVIGNVTGGTNIALSYDVFNGVTNRITADQVNGIGTYPTISIQGGGYTAAGIYIDPVGTANPNVSSGLYSYFSSADGYFHTINVQASTGLDAAQQVTIGGASTADGLLQFSNAATAFYLRFKPGATANNITYILPITDPTAGQVLSASAPVAGVSTLSWAANGGTPALTATQVAYGSAGNTMTSSANLIFDNANTQLSITGSGTAALPALSVGGTTNGMLLSATNQLGWSTNGVTRMTLDDVSLQSVTNGGFLLARAAGSATDPTYSFKNDSNTGFYSNVADTIKATFGGTQYATWDARGLFIGGTTTPTAKIHLGAETASASTGPIKFTAPGALLTAPEALVLGPSVAGDDLHFTITTGAARKRLLMADPVGGLTSTRVPFATTNGRLTDSANMTFVTDTLFVEKLKVGTGSVTLDAINHGSYAPTATGVTNVGSVSATSSGWYRIGRKVHVYGIFSVDPDAAGTITQFTLDLPIASDLTNAYDLSGGATNSEDSETAARIYADTASDLALVEFRPKAMTTSYDWSFWFDYEII